MKNIENIFWNDEEKIYYFNAINNANFNNYVNSLFEVYRNEEIDNVYLYNILDSVLDKGFSCYSDLRKSKAIYKYDYFSKNLIILYHMLSKKIDSNSIGGRFRTRYVEQESRMEDVYDIEERDGLKEVYNYVTSEEWKNFKNIFLVQKLHSLLYSKVPFPEVGGSFRNCSNYVTGSDIPIPDYSLIIPEILKLDSDFKKLLEEGELLGKENVEVDSIINYIDNCIKLKCEIIKIHPFFNGNGRVARALTNTLFVNAGLPPVYIKNSQKDIYREAMHKAIVEKDYKNINKFYHFRICDSIYTLYIRHNNNDKNKNMSKVLRPSKGNNE